MYSYHSGLTEGHPYGSAWYTWPVIMRPIYYYSGGSADIGKNMGTSIVSMGNPLVWWTGLACIIPALFYTWKKRDKGMLVAFVGYAVQFFPWILVTRVAFIYHYFTIDPLNCLFFRRGAQRHRLPGLSEYCHPDRRDMQVLSSILAISVQT